MAKKKGSKKKADITVTVDLSRIVRNVSIAGVCIVGAAIAFNTYRKVLEWKNE